MTKAFDLASNTTFKRSESATPTSSDEYDFITEKDELPHRTRLATQVSPMSLELHPIVNHQTGLENSLLISIYPPRQPETYTRHVPCDIVLVIDVSGSMSEAAPLPDTKDDEHQEVSGLSILDLTKHAARTILETLNAGDRLAIVTFSIGAKIILPLTRMTDKAKADAVKMIASLRAETSTNLWAGIRTGLQVIEKSEFIGNVQGVYVLTDGQPNHMCPQPGYVRKLQPMLEQMAIDRPCAPTIHTFGFGYSIASRILQSIAEVGNGSYAFIPEAGMIGTVFVHAVANLYTTYVTSAKLIVSTEGHGRVKNMLKLLDEPNPASDLELQLGNIQYGQSRDTIVHVDLALAKAPITVALTYKLPSGISQTVISTVRLSDKTGLPRQVIDFHVHRHNLLRYFEDIFLRGPNGEYAEVKLDPASGGRVIEDMVGLIHATSATPLDPNLSALLRDLQPSSPEAQDGQISHALTQTKDKSYWRRWGRHYLPSLWHAHLRQQCNSFKDPGPLCYGKDSPLFIQCRDELDKAFDDLPPPTPSYVQQVMYQQSATTPGGKARPPHQVVSSFTMSRYNFAGNPCFLGSCMVKTADNGTSANGQGEREVQVQDLRAGMSVLNLLTGEARKIAAVIKTPAQEGASQQICRVGDGLWITPYHPVFHRPSQKWVFPIDVADEARHLTAEEAVYSVLLTPSKSASSHAMEIGGISCVTLGHGQTRQESTQFESADDVRTHPFFGDHSAIVDNISMLPQDSNDVYLCAGVTRDKITGLINGFMPDLIHSSSASIRQHRRHRGPRGDCVQRETSALYH